LGRRGKGGKRFFFVFAITVRKKKLGAERVMAIEQNEQSGSRRLASVDDDEQEERRRVQRQREDSAVKTFGKFTLRGKVDDLPQ
jgi:hypothetical protein